MTIRQCAKVTKNTSYLHTKVLSCCHVLPRKGVGPNIQCTLKLLLFFRIPSELSIVKRAALKDGFFFFGICRSELTRLRVVEEMKGFH